MRYEQRDGAIHRRRESLVPFRERSVEPTATDPAPHARSRHSDARLMSTSF